MGCCHGFSLAFLLFIARRGVDGSPETLIEGFVEELPQTPIVSLQYRSELTLASIVDIVSRQCIGTLDWWRKKCCTIDDSIVERGCGQTFPPFNIKLYRQDWLTPVKEILSALPPSR